MKYIVCEEPGQFLLQEKDAPQFKRHEALLAIKTIGICGTDLHAYAETRPSLNILEYLAMIGCTGLRGW